ncbi:gastrula zinc finger protein XlCGF57.1-like isoform X2 [Dermacentor albipictus]|uniref:gastrula zinc finger protein XlCGF57.1-like isoform X2 n=1 Tax=Dermacentor albipictus TaxID=60249 RepID=UPI0038FCA7AD
MEVLWVRVLLRVLYDGLTNAVSLAESIAAKMVCHSPTEAIGQVEVGTQCCSPVADKSVGCTLRAGSESRSVQTTETVDQSSATTGLTNAMSLAESIAAKMVYHSPSEAIVQLEAGTQCTFPLADKSVGCCFRAGSESRSVQTTETVDQSSYTSASRPSISPSAANSENSQQGCLQQDHFCDYEAGKLFRLEAHGMVSTGERLFKCDLCCKSFSTRDYLKSHMRTHTASRPSISPSTANGDSSQKGCLRQDHTCDYETDKRFCLEAHANVHTGKRLFKCHLCPRSFSRRDTLKRHLCIHKASRPSISPSTANGDSSQQGCLRQDHLCDNEPDKLFRLGAHASVHTGERPFKCHLCPQSFSKKDTLKRHLCVHAGERPFQCPSCHQRFSQRSKVKEHLRTHTGERPFQCPSCLQSFLRKTHLKAHLRIHTGEKPWQCPSCLQSFSHKTSLNGHLRTHTEEKPFQCPSCSRSFSRKSSMKDHLRTHTGDKPFQCPSCPQSFARKTNLTTHLKIHLRTRKTDKP